MEKVLESFDKQDAAEWGKLISDVGNKRQPIKLLIGDKTKHEFVTYSCHTHKLQTDFLSPSLNLAKSQIQPTQNVVICDSKRYDSLFRLLTLLHHQAIVVLVDEMWTPDWCWHFRKHLFLTRQDLNFS
ncbi:hypothetical protein [Veronia pacifica]|uniref:Uncharacterized protein n=1 Tax=Veronia pacifica TaxID=1080227 RepID=A0A1C3EPY9_9GAMM|nr:hypothetical protein [Veronia pacifica]ODA35252.1 hypothetical protein A8L45_04900 [Veronia pacifica]